MNNQFIILGENTGYLQYVPSSNFNYDRESGARITYHENYTSSFKKSFDEQNNIKRLIFKLLRSARSAYDQFFFLNTVIQRNLY